MCHRKQYAEDRNEHDGQPADQFRHPEREIFMQERQSRFIETQRFAAQWKLDGFGRRKLIGAVENAGARVDLGRGIEQQILNRGMQIAAYHQARLRRDQSHIGRRLILGQIYYSPGQHQLGQKRIDRNERVRARIT